LNIPLENVAQALEEEAYISLSWMQQVYSTPEVMEFETPEDMAAYLQENSKTPIATNVKVDTQTGEPKGVVADFLPVLDLGLDQDNEGNLVESPEDRFFKLGVDIKTTDIKWEGKINVQPQSIISPSIELERQQKTELYNLIIPTIQLMSQSMMTGQPQLALALYKPTEQLLEVHDEKPESWLPDDVIMMAQNPQAYAAMQQQQMMQQQQQANPLFVDAQGQPQAGDTVVGRDQVTNPARESVQSAGNFTPQNQPIA
jgi:hypothetical protein